ncbi:signal peptidase I [candidate division KSB1 bacterium]|nr:signal peptidase I [candidate division KSB1 bacterium]
MNKKFKSPIGEYIEAFAIALIAALILRALVVQAFRIPTGSMKDTLLIGDFLLVNKFIYGVKTPDRVPFTDIDLPSLKLPGFKKPERSEIIVFKYPLNPKQDYIKRCIGLPGDTIEVRKGIVYINNRPEGEITRIDSRVYDLEERRMMDYYRVQTGTGRSYTIRHYSDANLNNDNYGPVVVPSDHLFMMGDNRDNSSDSRYWGFMPMENLVGRAMVIYMSWDSVPPLWNPFAKIRWSRIFGVIR